MTFWPGQQDLWVKNYFTACHFPNLWFSKKSLRYRKKLLQILSCKQHTAFLEVKSNFKVLYIQFWFFFFCPFSSPARSSAMPQKYILTHISWASLGTELKLILNCTPQYAYEKRCRVRGAKFDTYELGAKMSTYLQKMLKSKYRFFLTGPTPGHKKFSLFFPRTLVWDLLV